MNSSYFPFDELGLRGNPFQNMPRDEWAQLAILPDGVRAAWIQSNDLLVLGEKGYGKTTTLLGVTRLARQHGRTAAYERLPQGTRRFRSALTDLDVFVLDEAQRLNWRGRRQLAAVPPRVQLVIGSHTNLSATLERAGRRPTVLDLANLSFETLTAILQRRLEHVAQPGSAPFQFADSAVEYLLAAYGADQRAMNALLYEYFQRLPAPGTIADSDLARLATRLEHDT